MKKIWLLLILLLYSSSCLADEYVLVKGQGCEVCEEYRKNLNSYTRPGQITNRIISPGFEDLSKPKWQQFIDVLSTRVLPDANIHLKISDFLWKRDVNAARYFPGDLSEWKGTKKQYTDAYKRYCYFRHEISRWTIPNNHLVTEVDIDNDGVPEPVYLDQMYSTPTLMLVLNSDYSDIDYEKTKLIMIHPSRKEAGWKNVREISLEEKERKPEFWYLPKVATGDALSGLLYDVFHYKKTTYVDLWGLGEDNNIHGNLDPENRLRVFLCSGGKTSEICTYKVLFAK